MADNDDDYEIGALLGAPVRAIQEAQIDAERQYVEFLLEYGMEETSRKIGNRTVRGLKLREFEFGMTRNIADPARPGEVVDYDVNVRAPLLSIIQVPAIGIEEATIELDLDVRYDKQETNRKSVQTKGRARAPLLPQKRFQAPVLKGSVGAGSINRKFRTHGKLAVKLKLRATHDDELHGRLSRLIGEGLTATTDVPDSK